MKLSEITGYRLATQQIIYSNYTKPEELVEYMGAMQAQMYQDALWAVGLRLKNATIKEVEQAIEKRHIVRTWPMRQTLHFVPSKDVRWMLSLYREQTIPTYQKENGLTEEILKKGTDIIIGAFDGKDKLTSKEIYTKMASSGNPILLKREVQAHILRRAGRDGVVCYASHDEKTPKFALLDRWAEKRNDHPKEHSFVELASRYFTSHGPATIKDFTWWSGLKVSDAKTALDKLSSKLTEEKVGEKRYYMPKHMPKIKSSHSVRLLPAFDEYLISYSDRSAALGSPELQKAIKRMLAKKKISIIYKNGFFTPVIVVDGLVVGTWKKKIEKDNVSITLIPYVRINKDDMKLAVEEAERYGRFLEKEVVCKIS